MYDLDTWPRNPITNFKFKNCLSGATTIVKNVFSGYEITFDSAGLENYFARTFVIIMFAIIKILFIMIIIIFLLMEKKSNN